MSRPWSFAAAGLLLVGCVSLDKGDPIDERVGPRIIALIGLIFNEAAFWGGIDLILQGTTVPARDGGGAINTETAGYDGRLVLQNALGSLGVPGFGVNEGQQKYGYDELTVFGIEASFYHFIHTASPGTPPHRGGFSSYSRDTSTEGGPTVAGHVIQAGTFLAGPGDPGETFALYGAGAGPSSMSIPSDVAIITYRVIKPISGLAGFAAGSDSSTGGASKVIFDSTLSSLIAAGFLEEV